MPSIGGGGGGGGGGSSSSGGCAVAGSGIREAAATANPTDRSHTLPLWKAASQQHAYLGALSTLLCV